MKQIITALYNSVLFKGKTKEEIISTLSSTEYFIQNYNVNEMIFSVDQNTNHIGIILDGCIEAQKHLASGQIVTILSKNQGDLFGEGSVFSKAQKYPCNIVAKNKSTILLITKENMLKLLTNDFILLNNFLYSFADRILTLNLKTELLSYSSIQQKIAFSLLYLMDDYKYKNTISLPFSKKTWSEYLNVSRPSLFRELKVLSCAEIITLHHRQISILNNDALLGILNN